MIEFNSSEGRWKLASIVATVVMIGCVAFDRLVPVQSPAQVAEKRRAEVARLRLDSKNARDKISESRTIVEDLLWLAETDEIVAQAMAVIDGLATKNQVKVQAFRPQRTLTDAEIDRLPFSVVVRGPFPRVLNLVRSLQAPGTMLALTSVFLTAADGETDTVTTTIGVTGFAKSSTEQLNGK